MTNFTKRELDIIWDCLHEKQVRMYKEKKIFIFISNLMKKVSELIDKA